MVLLQGPCGVDDGGCLQGWNGLQAADMLTLAEALRFNQSVHSIELQHNALGADGGAALGEVLYDNRCATRNTFGPTYCIPTFGRPQQEAAMAALLAMHA